MRFWKRKKEDTFGQGKSHRRFALAYWPDDIAGWLRIPSMIAGLIGILGVMKYTWQPASILLASFNLPSVALCWWMLGAGSTVYLLSLAFWLFVEDVAKTCRPQNHSASDNSSQWRSM